MAISEFWSGDLGKNLSVGGGLGALQFFGHLKRALELLISIRIEPLDDILGPMGREDNPEKKNKKKTNKHTSVICHVAKNTKFHIFVDRSLKPLL